MTVFTYLPYMRMPYIMLPVPLKLTVPTPALEVNDPCHSQKLSKSPPSMNPLNTAPCVPITLFTPGDTTIGELGFAGFDGAA